MDLSEITIPLWLFAIAVLAFAALCVTALLWGMRVI